MKPENKLKAIVLSIIGVIIYLITRFGAVWDNTTWENRKYRNSVEIVK